MAERRSHKRIAAQLKVWCEGEDFTVLASTLNLSRHGLFLRTARPFPPSTRLRLTIDELGVIAEGEVRWGLATRDPAHCGVGVQLLSFESGAAAWERYVEQNSHRSGEHRILLPSEPPPE